MWQLLLLGLGAVVVLEAHGKAQGKRQEEFEQTFTRLPGDRRIIVEECRTPSEAVFRRFRPTHDPAPWELVVATDNDGMEQFAFRFHLSFKPFRLVILAHEKRPMHLERELAYEIGRIPKDPHYDNRFRYSHVEQGMRPWFLVHVESSARESWVFEHHSLYAELVSNRPALASPTSTTVGAAVVAAGEAQRRTEKRLDRAQEQIDRMKKETQSLRADLAELVEATRRYEQSSAGAIERLNEIRQIADVAKQMHAEVEALDGLDDGEKDQLHDVISLETDRGIVQFRQAVEARMQLKPTFDARLKKGRG